MNTRYIFNLIWVIHSRRKIGRLWNGDYWSQERMILSCCSLLTFPTPPNYCFEFWNGNFFRGINSISTETGIFLHEHWGLFLNRYLIDKKSARVWNLKVALKGFQFSFSAGYFHLSLQYHYMLRGPLSINLISNHL